MKTVTDTHRPRYARKTAPERRQLLVQAAIRCLADGGMAAFTIAKICQEAGVSQGLINHHFRSKDELLVSVYDTLTAFLVSTVDAAKETPRDPAQQLVAFVDANFDEDPAASSQLRAWLALWGEISSNPDLRKLHKTRCADYKAAIAGAISAIAKARGRRINADTLALMLVSLIDGLWLESRLDPTALSPRTARSACIDFLEDRLGPLTDNAGNAASL